MTVWSKETKRQLADALFATRTVEKPDGSYAKLDGRFTAISRRLVSRWRKDDPIFLERWSELQAGLERRAQLPIKGGRSVVEVLAEFEEKGVVRLLDEVMNIPTSSLANALKEARQLRNLIEGKPTEILLHEVASFWSSLPEDEKDRMLEQADRDLRAQQELGQKAN